MKTYLFSFFLLIIALNFNKVASPQGLPPGWEYVNTPVTHIISVPLISNPNINDYVLKPGDYIGVFYVNGSGGLSCGGAIEWTGIANTGIIAFGNDSFTPVKDGFANNELFNYKVYSWSVQRSYDAVVTCNDNLPTTCLNFVPNGLSGLASLDASGFYIVVEASENSVCSGSSVQLEVFASGGTGGYTYSWYSEPAGFSSNIANPVVLPTVSTSYFAQVANGSVTLTSGVFVEVVPAPIANAGNDISICAGQTAQLNGTAVNSTSFLWSSSGDGTFSNNSILNPVYTPGSGDIVNGSVELCLVAASTPTCPNSSDCLILTISPLPVVTLDPFPTYCAGDPSFNLFGGFPLGGTYYINGVPSVTFVPSNPGIYDVVYQFTSSNGCTNTAGGQIIVNPLPSVGCPQNFTVCCNSAPIPLNSATPVGGVYSGIGVIDGVFYPECGNVGDFLITYIYTDSNSGCLNSCSFTITVAPLPVVTCPDDFQVCINTSPFILTGALPLNGVYSGPGVNMNLFSPAVAGLGLHQIDYNYIDLNGCEGSCNFTILVKPLPSVNAGFPQVYILLPNTTISLSDATASNFNSIQWSTSGTGTFSDASLINPEYTLSEDDILAGTVVLTMTGANDCGLSLDTIIVIVNECQPAVVDAGGDATICEDIAYLISDANALLFESLFWSNNGGDGTFDDSTSLNPTYTPGAFDIQNGFVLLTLTAFPLELCDTVSDDKQLSIVRLPEVYSGYDQTICEDAVVELVGEASDYAFILWETNGDGSFENPWELQTTYFPGESDIAAQEVLIWLNVFPNTPCSETVIDELLVEISKLPYVAAGEDVTISAGENLQLNALALDFLSLLWSTSGDGAFDHPDILNPVYTPGEVDIQNAGAILELSAFPLFPCTSQVMDQLVLTIDTLTYVNPLTAEVQVRMYPNPVNGNLFISFEGCHNTEVTISLFSYNGLLALKEIFICDETDRLLNLSSLPNGLYLIRISSEKFNIVEKILIQNF